MSFRRLVWKTVDEKLNPLSYAFLFITLCYGIGFTVFGGSEAVITSGIWESFALLHKTLPIIWGYSALLSIIFWLLTLLTRREPWGTGAALLGFMTWLFAVLVLFFNGYWLVMVGVAIPNLYYWAWLYFEVMIYKRRRDNNLLIEPT